MIDRYIESGCVYIPYNNERDTFILYSCDNIYVLKSTSNDRNTFHNTLIVSWQR